jgi:tetratricopeptide (TPR) repeat protein
MSKSRKNADLHYYMGVIELSQHNYNEALEYIEKAIKYADDSIARDYMTKALCLACLSRFKEAIEDLEVTIKLEQNWADAYLLKGKCSYLVGDINSAFMSYQQLVFLEKNKYVMHIHAGNLLMNTGAIDDAAKAFTNADRIKESSVAFYQQAKVFLILT